MTKIVDTTVIITSNATRSNEFAYRYVTTSRNFNIFIFMFVFLRAYSSLVVIK